MGHPHPTLLNAYGLNIADLKNKCRQLKCRRSTDYDVRRWPNMGLCVRNIEKSRFSRDIEREIVVRDEYYIGMCFTFSNKLQLGG